MSRSSRSRGQTEPLAAILAVSIFATALGLYVVAAQPILPGFSDDATADHTIDRVWDDVGTDGVFHAHDDAADLETLVEGQSLPAGSSVFVTVTAVDDGGERPVAEAAFPRGYPDATTTTDVDDLERYVDEEGIPAHASVATRSIPVALESRAESRSGTLRVAVW